ncbi:MAG TPA: DUF5916 domain-containing protein [Candidatus Polarisedimenticolia bacterium]|nr:DUF5916 domain-containing protein [Candidatus Polarisedimenticolia bacterium]
MPLRRLAGVLVGLALLAPEARAAGPGTEYHVTRTGSAILIDGKLDEPAWSKALRLPLAYETYPGDNLPATLRTECLLTFDDADLYVAFRAFEPDPGSIRAFLSDRDGLPDDQDQVVVVLDTFDDRRRAYAFAVNPVGARWDAVASEAGGNGLNYDRSWDAIWNARAAIDREGYTIEMAIPFASLRFPRRGAGRAWGLHAFRYEPRSVLRQLSLMPIDRDRACFLCQEATLTGLSDLRTGLNLELDPTLTLSRSDERPLFPDGPMETGSTVGQGGLTARWTASPDLTLSAALDPDFSQVEADVAQLKINTRFALYYPERRPLFLEGADYFQTRLGTVYTRTVADPTWGARMVGKIGKNALGVMVARDRITNLVFPANQGSQSASLDADSTSAVVRYRRDVGRSSTLGLLLAGREAEGYSNGLVGLDGLIRLSESDTIVAQGLLTRTVYPADVASAHAQPDVAFRGSAMTVSYEHESKYWNWNLYGTDLGRNLRVDTGFLPRVDTRSAGAGLERVVWGDPQGGLIRMSLGASAYRTENHDGLLTDGADSLSFEWEGPLQSNLEIGLDRITQWFDGTTYTMTDTDVTFAATPLGGLSLSLSSEQGDEIDYDNCRPGRILRLDPGLTAQAGRHLRVALNDTYERLDVDGGRLYRAQLAQARLAWQFNVRAMARAIVQYSDIRRDPGLYATSRCSSFDPAAFVPPPVSERTIFTQLLFSYRVSPQTALYIGYTEDRLGDVDQPLTRSARTFFFKVGYAWLP